MAERLSRLSLDSLPSGVVQTAKRSLLDAVGCAIGALATDVGRRVGRAADRLAGAEGIATVLGLQQRTVPASAAFFNAVLINALDFDDAYGSHLSATVVPTCLAAAELADADGALLLEGLVVGYEMSCRVGRSLHRASERTLLHGHGTWQCLGATFGAARILGLSAAETVQAVGFSASNAPVPSVMKTVYGQGGPTDAKNNFGTASSVALTAVVLAAEGFSAPSDVLTGATGFWSMIGCDDYHPSVLEDGLGETFLTSGIGLKPYPACRLTQTTVGLTVELMAEAGATTDDIESILVNSIPILAKTPFTSAHPPTMSAAQYSVPYAVAAALCEVPAGPDWFSATTMGRQDLKSLAARVRIVHEPGSEETGSERHRADVPTEVSIVLKGGRTLRGRERVAYGDSRRPMTDTDLTEKFHRNLAAASFGQGWTAKLAHALGAVETSRSVRELFDAPA